ncbi:nucleotide-binding universal stress UspA family protein [Kribbella antiqua]|uniref:Nucleotide-binding universal stress UspA family protein n=1 Tax=Kribbella antiqua TaxID=2512217 RepID=A0A4R2IE07_9ACTN|nr:universal stress protein [Kribbella antiqua]TCO42416.1 nucleotide-binding universal stress UspA family protein [Kribbella antiqua]
MTKATAGNNRGRRAVVVGVDGSVSAQGALAWAAAEASSRHCPLRIVHAFSWPMLGNPLDMTFVGDMNNGLQSAAEWILTEAEAHAREVAPDIKVIANLFVGPAAPTLLSEAQAADLVVVGSRGVGGFRGLLVGSVSATVAAHAPCPVVVVHPHGDGTAFPSSPTGRIVVGVDGSEISAAAIRFAFQQAARRHIGITAVHAATPTRQHPSLRVPADIVDQIDRQLFAEAMESKRVLFPAIDVQTRLAHAHPAQALIDASAGAELVVVGSHGRGGFAGMLLGSVSQAVLQHAACPVAVVRPHRTPSIKRSSAGRLRLAITSPDELADLKELS